MNKRIFTLLMLLVAATFAAEANPVDMRTVREVAVKFVNANAKTPLRGAEDLQLVTTYRTESNDAAFHVFNTPNGFVIVSADDCATPILGYSDEGRPFDLENIPIQLQGLFNGYLEQFQYGFDNHLEPTEAVTQQWSQVRTTGRLSNNRDGEFVEPLLTTHWEQGWPFNAMCPVDEYGNQCLVGCLPVAVGQIMKYYNWPPKGSGYVHYGDISAVFDTTYYDWESMPDEWTDIGYESMAQLLSDIGKSMFAEFSPSATAVREDMMQSALADVFNYDYFSMQYIMRNGEDDDTWFELIKNELDNNSPVYYGGWDSEPPASSGHAWVCDGYDTNQMCHFNFGWGGQCDGYYTLSHIIDPFWFNYNYQQRIIIGIQPTTGNTLSGNETLSGSMTYDESLYCGAFSNVTIMPGTELKFAPGKAMCVTGSILANGTEDNPITITASDTTLGWGGMQIHPSMICYMMVQEPDTLRLNHTTISYSTNDGLNFGWPGYSIFPVTIENVVHEGLFLENVKIQHNLGIGISGGNAIITIDSCEVSDNGKYGIDLFIGSCNISNSVFHHNKGAINFLYLGEMSIMTKCKVYSNDFGHGNFSDGDYVVEFGGLMVDNEFYDNSPSDGVTYGKNLFRGGGLDRNSIHDNTCGSIMAFAGDVTNNRIFNNNAIAISIYQYNGVIKNNLIHNNSEGIYCSYNDFWPIEIVNNTIVNNGVGINYGEWQNSELTFSNNIIWNNGTGVDVHGCLVTANNNIINGGSANFFGNNPNNIVNHVCDKDPKFVNPTTFIGPGIMPENVNFSLDISSPAIDNAFYDTTMVLPDFDLNGNPRIYRTLDIGAYENQSDTIHPCFFSEGNTIKSCVGHPLDISFPYRGYECTFEWFHDNVLVPNAASDTLHIDEVVIEDVGDYYCVISNSIGVDTSSIIHVELSPMLPDCIETIYGTDTIHHFQKNIPFFINNVANADLIEWVVSDGLSFMKTSDTSILVSVHEVVDNAFLYVVASNGCGACADTTRIDFTVLPVPETIRLSGPGYIITDYEYSWPLPELVAADDYYYDTIEWQFPSWISTISVDRKLFFVSTRSCQCFSDTIFARWFINDYGYGTWTPFPIKVFHPEDYGDIVYVSTVSKGGDNGASWEDATDVKTALSLASYLDKVIWVASGTYYGNDLSDNAFTITDRIHVYGGFVGNEPADYDLSLRDLSAHQTVFDGQHLQHTIYHGWYWFQDIDSRPMMDGVVIQNGLGSNVFDDSDNGIFLRNCIIRNGIGDCSGASQAILENCILSNNQGDYWATVIQNSSATNCVFVNNRAPVSVALYSTLTNCILWNNGGDNQGLTNTFYYSAIQDVAVSGDGNIIIARNNDGNSSDSLYVRFLDPENGDFRLSCSSACINMGTPDISELGLPPVDLQGNPRVMDGRIDMGAYEFNPSVPINFIINVLVTPEEGGSVSGDGEYICGETCTLVAIPNEGYFFMNWTEDGELVSESATIDFIVTSSRTLVANFSPSHEITAIANPTEGGEIIGAGAYGRFSTCTLTALANEGYLFLNWTEDGAVVSTDSNYSFTVSNDRNLVANFEEVHMIGDGGDATDVSLPSYNYYKHGLSQQIYTAEELGDEGLITSIAFYNAGAEKTRTYDFYMKATEKASFAGATDWEIVTDFDKVFSGDVTMVVDDWTFITLDNPFYYDGTSNVVLVTDDNTGTYTNSPHMACRVFNADSQSIYVRSDGTNYDPSNPSSYNGTVLSKKNQLCFFKKGMSDCMNPTHLMATEVGPDFAVLSWTENGTATEWVVVCGDNTVTANTNEGFVLDGLDPETEYTIVVHPSCDETLYSNTITITTLDACPTPSDLEVSDITYNAATVVWTGYSDSYNVAYRDYLGLREGFEGGEMPAGWTIVGDNQNANKTWRVGVGDYSASTGTHSGSYNALITHNNRNEETYLISPSMNLSGQSDLQLSFWYVNRNWTGDIDGFGVYYRVDGGVWNELWSTTEAHSTWTNQVVTLSGLAANYQLGFKFTDHYGYGVGLDDITFIQGNESEWQTVTATGSPVRLTGLLPETNYEVKVQGVCDGTETEWCEIVTFTTPEATLVTQTFALSAGSNWVSFNVEITLEDLQAALVDALGTSVPITIKSKTQDVKYQNGSWAGSLTALSRTQMYKIIVSEACEITLEGIPVDPTTLSLTITPGANWIAFPYSESMSVTDFIGSFPINDDVVKSQMQNTRYKNGRWTGQLNTLVPGQGYMYNSASTEDRAFTFPTSAK